MLSEVIEENGVKKLRPLAGNFVNDVENVPVGVITAYWGTIPPENWLVCNGATFDTAAYPELYALLGGNRLPDLRESTLVGAGERASGVTTHDVYSIGQFRDDQVGVHTHCYIDAWGNETNALIGYSDGTQVDTYKALTSSPLQHSSWRWGVNHGWVYGALNNLNAFSTWGGTTGEKSGDTYARIIGAFIGNGMYMKMFNAVKGSGYVEQFGTDPLLTLAGSANWHTYNVSAAVINLSHNHGIPPLHNDHRHVIPYVGGNTDANNPSGRYHVAGERNGNVTRTKQTGVAFIIKAK